MTAEILGDFRACYKPPENYTKTGGNGRILGIITQKKHKNFAPKFCFPHGSQLHKFLPRFDLFPFFE